MVDINSIRKRLDALQSQNTRTTGETRKNIFWKPTVGKQTIRIVPSKYNKSNPFSELYFHYGIDKNPIFSPTNWGEKDPIVEFAKQLRGTKDKENWRLARKLDPKMRVFVPIIVRDEEAEGVRLWGFGKELYMELLSMFEDEDIGDYTDIVSGRDITLTTVGADVTGTGFNKTTIRARTKESPLAEGGEAVQKFLEEQPDPMQAFTRMSFDDMKTILQRWLMPDEEVEDSGESQTQLAASQQVEAPWASQTTLPDSSESSKPKTKADRFGEMFKNDLPF